MTGLEIKGFVETSLCDWDGCISSVVFLPRCNFRCPFCQNGELILEYDRLPTVSFESIARYLTLHRGWIDGVVITGGEPTLWDDLGRLAGRIKELGLNVKLDTNGSRPEAIEDLIDSGLVDYLAMDIKAPLDERYNEAAGVKVPLEKLRRSIQIVSGFGDAYEFRTTLVPGLVGEDELRSIAEGVEGAKRLILQRFVPENSLDKRFRRAVPYGDGFVTRLLEIAGNHVETCLYRGKTGVGLS
jgi:pyruvate formate lyase activating enzyme